MPQCGHCSPRGRRPIPAPVPEWGPRCSSPRSSRSRRATDGVRREVEALALLLARSISVHSRRRGPRSPSRSEPRTGAEVRRRRAAGHGAIPWRRSVHHQQPTHLLPVGRGDRRRLSHPPCVVFGGSGRKVGGSGSRQGRALARWRESRRYPGFLRATWTCHRCRRAINRQSAPFPAPARRTVRAVPSHAAHRRPSPAELGHEGRVQPRRASVEALL